MTSISVKAAVNKETTDILIITSPSFQPLLQMELECFDLPLYYYTLDLHTLFEAGCARLNIFKYNMIHKYDKILYLDTDILLNSDVNILFNLDLSSEKLYALEEGTIGEEHWGSRFFDFTKYKKDQTAFTSGVLLFKNSECIKSLFDTIHLHIVDYVYIKKNAAPECLDQPFIVYNAISQNKYENQSLKKYVENNPSGVSDEKIVYHFPGSPGEYHSKLSKMIAFWKKMNINTIVDLKNKKYTWEKDSITFLENGEMDAFGKGNYAQLDTYTFQANFGCRTHTLVFNNDYTEFTSTRYDDNEIVKGILL